MTFLINNTPNMQICQLSAYSNSEKIISLSLEIINKIYDQVFTQLVRDFEFVIRDDR